jgi:hypothetical protein
MNIVLSPVEMQHAAWVGALRHIESTRQRLSSKFGADENDGWTLNIEGAAGELAVAKALDRHWGMPLNTFRVGGDVGDLQVRTRSKHHYELLVRPHDRDEDIFILVTGRSPYFRVHGFMIGAQAKREQWLRAHAGRPPAFFVPQTALTPITDLVRATSPLASGGSRELRAG